MTQAENDYREHVFLGHLRHRHNRSQDRLWSEHQAMQLSFLQRRGLRASSTVLDLGCGPMRLGSVLIPELSHGWYYGQDLNAETLTYGEEVLRQAGIPSNGRYTLFASDQFNLSAVDRPIEIAFSNSLFSHLNLNSILTCLLRVRQVLAPGGFTTPPFLWRSPIGPGSTLSPVTSGARGSAPIPTMIPTTTPLPCCRPWRPRPGSAWI